MRKQGQVILSLIDCLTRLERRTRRGWDSRSSLLWGMGSSIYGTAWMGEGSQESLTMEQLVKINFLLPISNKEEEVQENEVSIPVPGLSHPSPTDHLGVNYQI